MRSKKISRRVWRCLASYTRPAKLRCSIGPHLLITTAPSSSGSQRLYTMPESTYLFRMSLVNEDRAREMERQLVGMLTSATVAELESEWDLVGLCTRPIQWFDDTSKSLLSNRLSGHLGEDSFVLSLLRSSAGFSYFSSGEKAKRLPWLSLSESFGDNLPKGDRKTGQLGLIF